MSDISKCGNASCPLRHTCWRWLAPVAASGYQTWMVWEPVKAGEGWNCDGYWLIGEETEPNDDN